MIYNSPFKTKEYPIEVFNRFQKNGVVVFGTGNFGSLINSALKQKNIKVNYFVDNNFNNCGKKFENIETVSAEDMVKKKIKILIF